MHQFIPELAVLQSAFELADKTYTGGLRMFTKQNHSERTLEILKVAIEEICVGLQQECTEQQRSHWRLKITAVMAAALLGNGTFCVAGARMPMISWPLFFEVVKKCGRSKTLLQLLDLLPVEPATRLIQELFSYTCVTPVDESDVHFVTTAGVHLLAHHNVIVFQTASSASFITAEMTHHLLSTFLGRVRTVATLTSASDRVLLFIALLNLYTCHMCGHCIVKENAESMNLLDASPHLPLSQQIVDETIDALHSLLDGVDVDCVCECLATDSADGLWARTVTQKAYDCLLEHESSKTCQLTETVRDGLKKLLGSVLQNVAAGKSNVGQAVDDSDELTKALFVISERVLGFEDLCDWMVNTVQLNIILDKRWLQCLQSNIDVFSTQSRFLCLCQRVTQLVSSAEHAHIVQKLRQVLLEIFRRLPVSLYHYVLCEVYSQYNIDQLFGVDNGVFQPTLLSTFNQLVNLTGDFPQMFRMVAILALQSPAQVLRKLLSDAIENAGQLELLSKLIQELASVGDIPVKYGVSLLCFSFEDILTRQQFTAQKNAGLRKLTSLLLKPFLSNLHADYQITRKPVLDTGEFLEVCLLPYIHWKPASEAPEPKLRCTALSLLHITMETLLGLTPDWVAFGKCHSLAIVACLCGVIDSCQRAALVAGDDDVDGHLEEMKDAAIHALSALIAVLVRHQSQIAEKSLSWLYDKLQEFDWTISLHVHPLLSSLPRFQLMFPASLCKLLCQSDTHSWTEMDTNSTKIPLVWLFELCRTTDDSLLFAKANICKDTIRSQPNLYSSVITILAQMLPYCTGAERDRLVEFVHYLIQDGMLVVQNEQFGVLEAELCAESSPIWHVETSFSHFIRDLLQVSGSICMSTVSLQRVCQACVTALQKFCIQALLCDPHQINAATKLAVIFRDVCLCERNLPANIPDQMTVLILQIASGCAALLRQYTGNESGKGQSALECSRTRQRCKDRLRDTAGLLKNITVWKTVLNTLL